MTFSFRTTLSLAVAVVLLPAPSPATAQFNATPAPAERPSDPDHGEEIPEDTIDQTGDDEDDDDDRDENSPFDTFDDITVERVQPDEIPDFQPGLPDRPSSRMDASDLPRTLNSAQMRQISEHVASSTVEIVAVTTPPEPYRATDMVYRGHALWLSPHESGDDPVLVATADWLENADRIYAIDGAVGRALSRGGLQPGSSEPQPIEDFSADAGDLLERHRDRLVALEVKSANRHVNLARLGGAGDVTVATPDQGLVLHNMDNVMPGSIFGFSPSVGPEVVPVGYEDSDSLERELSFYFLVNFRAILGAPLVGPDGRVIGITALRHPNRPEHTLAIPPGAIHGFLNTARDDAEAR